MTSQRFPPSKIVFSIHPSPHTRLSYKPYDHDYKLNAEKEFVRDGIFVDPTYISILRFFAYFNCAMIGAMFISVDSLRAIYVMCQF